MPARTDAVWHHAAVDQRSEFLPKPAWRTRARPGARRLAIGVTFAGIFAVGWLVLGGALALLDYAHAPAWALHAVWIVPTVGAVVWALLEPAPATASEDEAQPWSDYVVRAVMVGVDTPRPIAQRLITGIAFGAPLVVYLAITLVLEAAGLF